MSQKQRKAVEEAFTTFSEMAKKYAGTEYGDFCAHMANEYREVLAGNM
jgi:hypothetical protein